MKIHRPFAVPSKIFPFLLPVKQAVIPMNKPVIIPVSTPNYYRKQCILINLHIVKQTPIVQPKPGFRAGPNIEQEKEAEYHE